MNYAILDSSMDRVGICKEFGGGITSFIKIHKSRFFALVIIFDIRYEIILPRISSSWVLVHSLMHSFKNLSR